MKKILLLMIALLTIGGGNLWATKKYATYGTPAANGAWNAETKVYTWTESNSNLMTIFEFPNGELANYTSLHLTTADTDNTNTYRVCFMNGSTAVATIAFYSAGEKNLTFSERNETKDLDLSKITHISFGGASGSGSITLTSTPYLVKPTAVEFDETGVALIDLTDISIDSNLTFDDQTGVMTSNGQGTFSVALDNEDFSSVTKIELLRSGDDIVQTLQITDATNGVLNTWYSSKYSVNFADYQSKAGAITKLSWNCNTEGTMTITGIRITSDVIIATNPAETPLTADLYKTWDGVDADATATGDAGSVYGIGTSTQNVYGDMDVNSENYADLSAYDELRLVVTSGTPRLLLNRAASKGSYLEINSANSNYVSVDGTLWTIDLAAIKTADGYVHLNCIKGANWADVTVVSAILYQSAVESEYDYVLSGSGVQVSSVIAALADATAKIYDATGITGTGITLTPANPNAIFIANDGVLANTENVMVGTTIANLVVTDGYPMAVPTGASATTASYTRTMANTYGTVCLPFAVTSDANYKYYTLGTLTEDELTLVEATTLPAGTPGVVEKLNGGAMAGSGALANVQAASGTLQLIGTFKPETILASDYPNNIYAISNNQFVQATKDINLPAFRAFFTTSSNESAIRFGFEDEGVTGVNALTGESGVNIIGIYSLDGAAQPSLQKGVNIVKFSDGGVKKIMVK